jgi:hypothetical protein
MSYKDLEKLPNIITNKNPINKTAFDASSLTISTCTVITNLNAKVNLCYLTRFINIYEQNAPELDLKTGGVYNLEFYGNCARGETLVDKIKDEFNNQTTVKFKYWGFRNVNVKIFANGKLQMTGLKYENEAKEVGNLLIDIINNTKLNVLQNIKLLGLTKKTFDYQVVYDNKHNKVFYYRKYYDRFLKNYNFDINKIYSEKKNNRILENNSILSSYSFNIKRKNFIKGIHDVYIDLIEGKNIDFLKENEWYGDNEIMRTIDKIELIKTLFVNDMEDVLSSSKTLFELSNNIDKLSQKYQDFKFNDLDEILMNISKNIYSTDENTLVDIKTNVYQFVKYYRNLLEKKINRLVIIRNIDVLICYNLEKYLELNKTVDDVIKFNNIKMENLDLITGEITSPYNYHVSNTTTVLINSDFTVNFNINLMRLSKILIKKGMFNTYEPDDHSGINLKYYYNTSNIVQGFCNCNPHCSTKEKHPVCTKITILIFRPGSIIITGSRNLEQLKCAHELIIKLMQDNMNAVIVKDNPEDNKHIALMNNEFRKLSRKTRLFYIKKSNLITE